MGWLKRLFAGEEGSTDQGSPPPRAALSAAADAPRPFGYKCCWLALRCPSPEEAAAGLGLAPGIPANWETGLACVWEEGRIFLSPCLDGYVLAIGVDALDERREALARLAARFPQVQFFGTHRVAEYHCWARYGGGALERGYCYVGERGEVTWDEGAMTQAERTLGFEAFPKGGDGADADAFPGEEDVLRLAAAWGVDPLFREKTYPPGVGLVCAARI